MSFRDIIGHEAAMARLRTLAKTRALGPAYLFHGPAGVGKHRTALAFAAALLCDRGGEDACGECASCGRLGRGNEPNLIVPETKGEKEVIAMESVRDVQKALSLLPSSDRLRVCVVDEAERMQDEAGNALLKTLEEAPRNTVFLMIASNPERLLPTIVSRCQSIRFGPLSPEDVARVLRMAEVPASEAGILAGLADGRPGEALRLRESGALERRRLLLEPFVERGASAAWIDAAVAAGKGGTGTLEGTRGRAKELLGFLADPLRLALRMSCGAPSAEGADALTRGATDRFVRMGDAEMLAGLLEALLAAQRALDANANAALWIENALVAMLEAQDRGVGAGRS